MNIEITNKLWVEKYRPKTIEDIVLPEEYSKRFSQYIQQNDLPSLLLYGPPGSGKTTISRIMISTFCNNIEDNVLITNGSAKETRGIGFVSDTIEPFLKIPPASPDRYKIIFIDEADYLTDAAFSSLRGVIEKYSKYGRFIFTCNYINKIPDAIQSRFVDFKFSRLPIEFITNYCKKILDNENIEYDVNDVLFIINQLYPDVRKIVNKIQKSSTNNKLIIDKSKLLTLENKIESKFIQIIDFIKNNQKNRIGLIVNDIISIINENYIDYRDIYTKLFYNDKIPVPVKIIVNKYANTHNNCLVDSMHFSSMIFESIKSINDIEK